MSVVLAVALLPKVLALSEVSAVSVVSKVLILSVVSVMTSVSSTSLMSAVAGSRSWAEHSWAVGMWVRAHMARSRGSVCSHMFALIYSPATNSHHPASHPHPNPQSNTTKILPEHSYLNEYHN